MKFLVISTFKDTILTVSPSVVRKAMEASLDGLNQHKKAGKILEMYLIPGWNRLVIIGETKSVEEIVQNISEPPGSGLYNIEVYPLADLDESRKILLESVKAAEKIMPGPPK